VGIAAGRDCGGPADVARVGAGQRAERWTDARRAAEPRGTSDSGSAGAAAVRRSDSADGVASDGGHAVRLGAHGSVRGPTATGCAMGAVAGRRASSGRRTAGRAAAAGESGRARRAAADHAAVAAAFGTARQHRRRGAGGGTASVRGAGPAAVGRQPDPCPGADRGRSATCPDVSCRTWEVRKSRRD